MTLHPVTRQTSVNGKERLISQTNRQQARNRQRSMLMRTIQQVAADQM